MYKKFAIALALVCVFAFSGAALAAPPFGAPWIISYDGYLCMDLDLPPANIFADTLIVVTNSHPSRNMGVWIEVYDKYGVLTGVGQTFYNGGQPLTGNILAGNRFGWITLGMIVPRTTKDPYGVKGGEKFSFRIYTAPGNIPPVVEVKQVIYGVPIEYEPGEAIWMPGLIHSWSEAALGGLNGPGVVKAP